MNLTGDPITQPSVVVRGSPSGFIQEIVEWHHLRKADEPSAEGGGEIGPASYELLLAALGACTSMTVGMYALWKGWPLEGSSCV